MNRDKKGRFIKGSIPWSKGKHHTEESILKMSKAKKGDNHRLGKYHSEETKLKMSLSAMGKKGTRLGAHNTEESKLKFSESRKGHIVSDETRQKIHKVNTGKKHTEEAKLNMSMAQKKIGNKPPINFGEKNWNWKGGITPESFKIRNSVEYKDWRKLVYERDNYTCQECNKRGYKLHAHHIESFSGYPELRFEVSNGITYCKDCHKNTDNYGNRERVLMT